MEIPQPTAHVLISIRGRWGVWKSDTKRAGRRFDTRSEAIRYGHAMARRKGLILVVHTKDGRVLNEFWPEKYRDNPAYPKKKK